MVKKAPYSKKLVEAYKTLASFIVRGGKGMPPHWPISIIETNWYYSQFFAKELYSTITDLEKRGISDKEMAELFWGPSTLSHWFYIANPVSFKDMTPKESEEFLEKTIDLLSIQRRGDIFCQNWRNKLLSDEKVKKLISQANFIEVDVPEIAKILAKINITLWHYCILIQIGHRSYSQEFHGPYNIGNGEILFVRDYFNLKPKEIWKFTSTLPFTKLRFLEVYKGVDIKIDMFNHFEVVGSLPQNLRKLSILVDDSKPLKSRLGVQNLFKDCDGVLEKGNKSVKNFSKKDWVEKIIKMRFFWLKPEKEILGKDWKPPKKVIRLVDRTKQAETATMNWVQNMRAAVSQLSPNKATERITGMFLNNVYQL